MQTGSTGYPLVLQCQEFGVWWFKVAIFVAATKEHNGSISPRTPFKKCEIAVANTRRKNELSEINIVWNYDL